MRPSRRRGDCRQQRLCLRRVSQKGDGAPTSLPCDTPLADGPGSARRPSSSQVLMVLLRTLHEAGPGDNPMDKVAVRALRGPLLRRRRL